LKLYSIGSFIFGSYENSFTIWSILSIPTWYEAISSAKRKSFPCIIYTSKSEKIIAYFSALFTFLIDLSASMTLTFLSSLSISAYFIITGIVIVSASSKSTFWGLLSGQSLNYLPLTKFLKKLMWLIDA
jgi:hypothetical protein